jgi:hypothetical protein
LEQVHDTKTDQTGKKVKPLFHETSPGLHKP